MPAGSLALPVADRFRDDVVLRGRSWAWLLALRQRLRAAVQMVNGRLEPVLPAGDGTASSALDGVLESIPASLRTAFTQTQQTGQPQTAVVAPLQIHCLPIAIEQRPVGALLVAREQGGSDPEGRGRTALETIGAALASAVEAHLGRASASDDEDIERIAALARLLSDAEGVRSERDVVAAFADALAIWHDVELRGYMQTGQHDYLLDVSLPGADLSRAPVRVPLAVGPEGRRLAIVPAQTAEELGLSTQADALAARVGTGRGSWLLILSGSVDDRMLARIEVYLDVLAHWVARRTADAVVRFSRRMTDELLGAEAVSEHALSRAIAALTRELPATTVSVRITDAAGDASFDEGERMEAAVDEVVVSRRGPEGGGVTVTLGAARRFTAYDCRLIDVAADLIDVWRRAAVRTSHPGERRRRPRSTDQVIERFAQHAVEQGVEVSVLVLATPVAAAAPDLTQRWLTEVRRSLRVSDLAGVLGDGALGVLLHDASAESASVVAARLRRTLEADHADAARALLVGISSRAPGAPDSALLADARRRASLREST